MRPRIILLAAAFAFGMFAMPRLAMAQNMSGFPTGHSDNPNGPTVSPYLNLLQTNSQGFNSYQTMVKPIVDQQNALQRQGSALQNLQQQVNQQSSNRNVRGSTGHTSYFMNYGHFYPARTRR
jgi:hypothetical protein